MDNGLLEENFFVALRVSKRENYNFRLHQTDAESVTVFAQIGNRFFLTDTENSITCAFDDKLKEISIINRYRKFDPASFFPVNR